MNKKYLIIGSCVIIVLILIVVLLFSQNTSSKQQQPASQSQTSLNQANQPVQQAATTTNSTNETTPTITAVAPLATTAQGAVAQFYNYYFASSNNPLANGAFKNNPYLAPDFKSVIGQLYSNGNTPVFCLQNKKKNIVVGKETPVDSTDALLMQETISEASPGNKDLYNVVVQDINDKWLIYDINCLP